MKQTWMVGIDEVGRGPWAGPLAAAAVVLPADVRIYGIKDSKLLKREQREKLALRIRQRAVAIGIGWAPPEFIDQYGLTAATRKAMICALRSIGLNHRQIMIDGNYNYLAQKYAWAQTLVKGDNKIKAISAASIIAKVARDNYMCTMAELYPGYRFESHVGYGTPAHRLQLQQLGPSSIHRLSYKPLWALT